MFAEAFFLFETMKKMPSGFAFSESRGILLQSRTGRSLLGLFLSYKHKKGWLNAACLRLTLLNFWTSRRLEMGERERVGLDKTKRLRRLLLIISFCMKCSGYARTEEDHLPVLTMIHGCFLPQSWEKDIWRRLFSPSGFKASGLISFRRYTALRHGLSQHILQINIGFYKKESVHLGEPKPNSL